MKSFFAALSYIGGVAYCAEQHWSKKKVFCLLPLKMESELKFHVNGHFALNYESRDCLVNAGSGNHAEAEWNERVLRQIVAPCAVRLIQSEVAKVESPAKECDAERDIKRVLDLLPRKSPQLDDLRQGVFERLGAKDVKVFPVVQITDKVRLTRIAWRLGALQSRFDFRSRNRNQRHRRRRPSAGQNTNGYAQSNGSRQRGPASIAAVMCPKS